ncbi:hydrogenase maturation nickel metallochaperone HypA [Neobacillus muris]|uniref:hydrogenase maturation nickel metallochaperone HypA/HybF n=1 Tax=Neobacillus muris TaxID=2941334 RepID=UPI00204251A1|nr:hydrogenase maturation nickel metallochaperone HypA [Neobacillus muris]
MHEMSLMGDIIQLVCDDAATRGIKRIEKIELTVGEISNAMPDALRMAFAIFHEQNPQIFTEKAELIIHLEAAKAKCVICDLEYRPDQKIALCPNCHVPAGRVLSGDTFQVLSYEGSKVDESNIKNRRTDE